MNLPDVTTVSAWLNILFDMVFGAVFGYLTWASGTMRVMIRAAKLNRWGLKLLQNDQEDDSNGLDWLK